MLPDDDGVFLESGEAADQLGVSASGMRRLAVIYESVHGDLPRKTKTDARLFSSSVIEKLRMARELVERYNYKSIAEALQEISGGVRPDIVTSSALESQAEVSGASAGVLLAEMRIMQERLEGLEAHVGNLTRQLEAPKGENDGDAELAEQRRLNQYLMGELERRSKLETTPRRLTWWRWWRRGEGEG